MGLLRDTYIYVDSNKEAIYSQNRILNEQNEILRENHNEELKTKDRVDISKVEYLELLNKAEKLKDMEDTDTRFYDKLAKAIKTDLPLLKAKDIESEIRVRQDIFGKDLIVKFTFYDSDLVRR